MPPSRRTVLAVAMAGVTLVTLFILRGLLGTIFFAITVAYILIPLDNWLQRRGIPPRWSAAGSTATAMIFVVGLFIPIGVVLYVRRGAAVNLIRSLPDAVTLSFEEFTYVIAVGDVTAFLARRTTQIAIGLAESMPVIAVKVIVFAFVVYGLLHQGDQLRRAIQNPVPEVYHDDLLRLHERIRETLYSIYIIQAVTAVATFAIALVVFLAFGIQFPVTLAVVAGLFQFLPVIGPSLVVAGLVIADVAAGDVTGAVILGVIGVLLIGVLPDAVLRPWLAQETARLPAAMYFVGVTGGLLSLGAIGIVAGPLIVVLLIELLSMAAEERTTAAR